MVLMTLGERLRQLREMKGLAQRQIGAIIEVDGAFISKVENNDKSLSRDHLQRLSHFFTVPEDELQTLWLADKIYHLVHDEKLAQQALNEVIKRVNN